MNALRIQAQLETAVDRAPAPELSRQEVLSIRRAKRAAGEAVGDDWPMTVKAEEEELARLHWARDWYAAQVAEVLRLADARWQVENERRIEDMRQVESPDKLMTVGDYRRIEAQKFERDLPRPLDVLGALSELPDDEQRLSQWVRRLATAGLLTTAEINRWRGASCPEFAPDKKRRLENEREFARLTEARDTIIGACGRAEKQFALGVYNRIGGPLTESKLDALCHQLVQKRLLDIGWLPGAKLGVMVQKLLHGG
jgi:hypothetical protein